MKSHRIKVLGLLGLPLIAIAVAVLVLSWGQTSSEQVSAVSQSDANVRIDLVVTGGVSGSCSTVGITDFSTPPKCNGSEGGKMNVDVVFTTIPDGSSGADGPGWEGWATKLVFSGLGYNPTGDPADEFKFGKLTTSRDNSLPGVVTHGDVNDFSPPISENTSKGVALNLSFDCDAAGSLSVVPRSALDPDGAAFNTQENTVVLTPPTVEIDFNCPTPTPSPTPSDTPTPTFTPTPTNTPSAAHIVKGDGTMQLVNLWLTAQVRDTGTGDLIKIPGANCIDSTDAVAIPVSLDTPVTGTDKAGDERRLGAFSFEVGYDNNKVCVEIIPGAAPAAWAAQAGGPVCGIEDSRTKPSLQGVATIHCNKQSKDDLSPAFGDDDELGLAFVVIRAQPEEYSISKPNNGNGNVVQILNSKCKVGDEQGDPVGDPPGGPFPAQCNDAEITIRYLEGDVDPDCEVDVSDTQAISFRWNTSKGTLLYLDRFNLEPSGAQADDDIDVLDLQFVYGRFGSTCEDPHPPQDPVNGKGP